MGKTKHTPGPWRVCEEHGFNVVDQSNTLIQVSGVSAIAKAEGKA